MNILKPVGKFFVRNGSLLLTIGASAGVVATSYFTAKSALKADKLLNDIPEDKLKTYATRKVIAKTYIPSIATGAATIACIIGAHLMNKRIQAGLIAAYGFVNGTFQMYRAKNNTEEDARIMREIDEYRINTEIKKLLEQRPDEEYELWIDNYRKHPYWARKSDILLGKDEVNGCLNGELYNPNFNFRSSLEVFYSHVKGEPEPSDCIFGWDIDQLLEECDTDHINVWWEEDIYTDPVSGKQIPCNHVIFDWGPISNYWNYENSCDRDSRN